MSNVERKGDVFGFVERRGSALCVLVLECFGLRIILGRVFGGERRVYIFNKKK